jgi:cysteine-rich repeat protein
MRRIALVCALSVPVLGCSFVDDFDKFKAATSGADDDAAVVPDDELDAALPGPDAAPRDADASTRADGALPGAADGSAPGDTGTAGDVRDGGDAAVVPRCGDGHIDMQLDEKCDDGNEEAGDGCEPKTCTITPSEICGGVSCNDTDPCTIDMCDATLGCVHRPIDADKDGYSPGKCKAPSGLKGGDCNDANPAAYPSAVEACDMVDNDCDGDVDDGAPMLRCYPDLDGDRFANQKADARTACVCPAGTIAESMPLDPARNDCWDDPASRGEDVFPGQTKFFAAAYGTNSGSAKRSFDYDCDGNVVPELKALGAPACGGLLNLLLCEMAVGFVGEAAPACGDTGEYATCSPGLLSAGCTGVSEQRTQSCH